MQVGGSFNYEEYDLVAETDFSDSHKKAEAELKQDHIHEDNSR